LGFASEGGAEVSDEPIIRLTKGQKNLLLFMQYATKEGSKWVHSSKLWMQGLNHFAHPDIRHSTKCYRSVLEKLGRLVEKGVLLHKEYSDWNLSPLCDALKDQGVLPWEACFTAKQRGIRKGSLVTHNALGKCRVLKVYHTAMSLRLRTEDGDVHFGIPVWEVELTGDVFTRSKRKG
jgi:hypothetical protein